MKKSILIPALIIGALFTGTLVMAGPGSHGRGGCDGNGPGAMNSERHEERVEQKLEIMTTVLELTEEQQTEIKTLLDQRHQDKQQLHEQMRASRDAMREARNAAPFNETDFRTKAAAQAELKADMMVEHVKLKEQIHALLTPEQQKKADTLGEMMGGHGKGRKHGRSGF
jgi:Spy/CpxP family protein refolding chaperone